MNTTKDQNYNIPSYDTSQYPSGYQPDAYYDYGLGEEPQPAPPDDSAKVLSVISMSCGIAGLLLNCCCACIGQICCIIAVVMGIIALLHKQHENGSKGMAITGIACGGVGLLLFAAGLIIRLVMFTVASDGDLYDIWNQIFGF